MCLPSQRESVEAIEEIKRPPDPLSTPLISEKATDDLCSRWKVHERRAGKVAEGTDAAISLQRVLRFWS